MAAQRPNVIVYQEYENLTVAPDIPDLNVIIVGPCYQILDYLDDKDDCYADDYGTLNSDVPLVDPSAVVLSAPPNIEAGGELDASSLVIYFDEARGVVVEDSGAAPQEATFAADDNLFQAHTTAAGVHFGGEEVAPGDILLTQSQGTSDYVKTVKEVLYVLNDYGSTLKFLSGSGAYDAVQEGDIVTLSGDQAPVSRDGTYTVLRIRDDDNLEFTGLDWTGNYEVDVIAGSWDITITVTSPAGAVRTGYPATLEMADYSDLRTTTDFELANDAVNRRWRVERDISDVELADTDYAVDDNEITLNAGIDVDLSATLLAKKVSYAKIYVEYKALRTDLQDVTELSNYAEMEAGLGKYDARNPLFVGAVVAKANTTTPISVYAVTGDTLTAYLDFIDRVSSVRDIYAIVPLTYTTAILAALNNMCESLADPNYVLTAGIKQKFRATIGAIELQTQKYMVNASLDGTSSQVTSPAPTGDKTLTYSQTGGTPPDFSALGVVPGCTVEVYDDSLSTTVEYTVAHVNGALVLEADGVVASFVFAASDTFTVKDAAGTQLFQAVHGGGGVTAMSITDSALDKLYLILNAPGASFLTSGVIPGDVLQMPTDPNSTTWTTYTNWTIDAVLSETRLRIVNNGNDTSLLANELPHLYKRADGAAVTQGSFSYRVMRNMTKAQQVDEMVAVATSFGSKRLLLCYPDLVDVSGLVDGSLPRSVASTPEAAASQPGYYLSCAVGGLTAGKPPQQGFTNMGIAGIDRIYNSSEYFKEEHLTELSNGGVYVFIQDNPVALPYSIHEVTTDVTALEFSEYMVVKDFDFVAWTYLDTMLPFLGEWNVIPSTIEFIRQALVTTGDTMKSRFVAKIGAPLTDYTIDSVEQSSLSTDRIEAYVDVDLPMTLNTIGLHLVA